MAAAQKVIVEAANQPAKKIGSVGSYIDTHSCQMGQAWELQLSNWWLLEAQPIG